jgi:predicted DNA binding CopG/RHH family protein
MCAYQAHVVTPWNSVKYFDWDRRLNIRLSSKDLEAIQKRALAEGLPYQTLIASLLHKYATGRLKEL